MPLGATNCRPSDLHAALREPRRTGRSATRQRVVCIDYVDRHHVAQGPITEQNSRVAGDVTMVSRGGTSGSRFLPRTLSLDSGIVGPVEYGTASRVGLDGDTETLIVPDGFVRAICPSGKDRHHPTPLRSRQGGLAWPAGSGRGIICFRRAISRSAKTLSAGKVAMTPGRRTLRFNSEAAGLRAAIAHYKASNGPVIPHRIFGSLTKAEWDRIQCHYCAHHLSFAVPAAVPR